MITRRRTSPRRKLGRPFGLSFLAGLVCLHLFHLMSGPAAATPRAAAGLRPAPLGPGYQLAEVEVLELEAVSISSLNDEEVVRERTSELSPVRFATAIDLSIETADHGSWTDLDNGDHVWRLRVRSPGARNLNLWFSRFEPPEGAMVWIYSVHGDTPLGPYRRSNANAEGQFWSPLIVGDEVVIELYLPRSSNEDAGIRIGAVNHGYRAIAEILSKKQGTCNIDVVCPQVGPFRDLTRAVAWYTLSGTTMCSGTLLNNVAADFAPLFLTALHCGVDEVTAASVVTYWNYESPTCGQLGGGNLANILFGASFLASYFPSDVTLIRLDTSPPLGWNPYYAGWDASGSGASSVVAIHHPGGDEKAASFEADPIVSVDLGNDIETHWLVSEWEDGTTEPGSSGSCIFDQVTGRCLGVLTTGTASCATPDGFDVFGKLSMAWEGGGTPATRLRDWLADGTQTNTLDGADPNDPNGEPPPPPEPPSCQETDSNLCLAGSRFEAVIDWVTHDGQGSALAAELRTDDSGLFYFFSPNNLEVLIKVLDGCGINDHYWVFYGAATDVEFTVTVTDTSSDIVKTYRNDGGIAADAVTDTAAFATCP